MTEGGEGVDADKRSTLRRFAALGAASPLVGIASANDSDSDVPDAIVGYLGTTPGAHFSKIRDDLKLGTGETQYHLRSLEDEGAVESRKDGDYSRYYPADQFDDFEKVALGYLRRDTARGMLIGLLRDPDATARSLAASLDVSRPTVSKYAAELERAGLLSREDGYAVRRPSVILVLLVRYADSFGPGAVDLAGDAENFIAYDPD